jgi:hypothetical protein
MPDRPEVLCFGVDPILNRTRRLILQPTFEVCVASTLAEAASWLQERRVRVVLLCHTLTLDDARAAMELARAVHPEARILALEEGHPRLFLRAPHQEVRLDGPADLLRRVAGIAGVRLPEPGAPAAVNPPRRHPSSAD